MANPGPYVWHNAVQHLGIVKMSSVALYSRDVGTRTYGGLLQSSW